MKSLLFGLIVVLAWPADSTSAPVEQKQVLVLYSTRRDAQIVVVGDRELPRILSAGLPEGVDYYSEFIDQARFSNDDYQSAFRDFLRLKYSGHKIDLLIAMSDVLLEFVDKTRDEVFPGTPIVFFNSRPEYRRPPNSTGLTSKLNLTGTLLLARDLQPDLKNIFVVTGAEASDVAYLGFAKDQFRPFESRWAFTYFAGLPTQELESRLAKLPSNSLVYYMIVSRDGANQNFNPLEYLDRISEVTTAPVYSWVDSTIDHGVVGGSLRSQVASTQAIAQLALRVLRGEDADMISIASPDLNVSQVDWRQLRRWGISESRVPAGTRMLFREPSIWDRYRFYIVGALVILFAQTALITGLLVQRARRRQAEDQVRGSQAALRTSYMRIRDLGARLLNAQETERSRIARDLHDDVSQQMAALAIDLELLGAKLHGDAKTQADEVLNRAQAIATSVHDLSHRLHPAKLRLIGLVAALEGLQREVSRSDVAITFVHENVPPALAPSVTLCLFRIVQEALRNALEHSGARAISVNLCASGEKIALSVTDDGAGFDLNSAWTKGLGLISMQERVEAIGGTLEIRSTPGGGTQLNVLVPLAASVSDQTVVSNL